MSFKLKKSVAVSDSGFVFNALTGQSYSVNPIGAEIIRLMKDQSSNDAVKSYILNTYETDEASFEKDYYDFVNMLFKFELVEKEDDEQQ